MATALVTGGNRGIGLELCRQLSTRGDHVIAAVRHGARELVATGAEVIEGVDATRDDGITGLVAAVGERELDLLVNNAGLLERNSLEALDLDSMRRQFEVNALGPLRVTAALHERLVRGGKLALITSRMGSIADNGSGGSYGYRMSKAALNAAGKSLAVDLAPRGVSIAILHPGWVQTEMTGRTGQLTAEQSAKLLLARIDAVTPETSGSFWHANGELLPW